MEPARKRDLLKMVDTVLLGLVATLTLEKSDYVSIRLHGLCLSRCYDCGRFSVWPQDRLIFPGDREGPQPISDMPDDVLLDFDEAREIVAFSPRGAAALLRLAIQKLCIQPWGKR